MRRQRVLITGGAGFIGSAVVRRLVDADVAVLIIDKLTYAGNLSSIACVRNDRRLTFRRHDICDGDAIQAAFDQFQPDTVLHLAAESHVDRSIDGPSAFIQTNLVGTFTLLDAALRYWRGLEPAEAERFRFIHVSTDEVFGALGLTGSFSEASTYKPTSPYSATKAGSDHLALAWHHTFGLPTLVSNCSNNYGPFQFPEKLIPLTILNALEGQPIPVYGRGENVRDWLYVDDHVEALLRIAEAGRVGDTYLIGGRNERRNIDIVTMICEIMDRLRPSGKGSHSRLIQFVGDRPGHDYRYAIDCSKIERELDWKSRETFESGLEKTVRWYLENPDWWASIRATRYAGERLGLAGVQGGLG